MFLKLPKSSSASVHIELLGKQDESSSNSVVFSHGGDRTLIPASTAKIITGIAAIAELGPGKTFKTKVFADGVVKGESLIGDLVILGSGDPYLVSERLWLLVRNVYRSGIRKISGGIKVNDSFFGEGNDELMKWSSDKAAYIGLLSAVSLNFNRAEIILTISPNKNKLNIELGPVPHNYAKIINQVRLVPGNKKNLKVKTKQGKDSRELFIVQGKLGRERKSVIIYQAVQDPAAYFGHVFGAMLRREGVEIAQNYSGQTNKKPETLVAEIESLPLADLVRLMNTYSNNFMAEQIYRILGAEKYGSPASSEKSKKIVNNYLKKYKSCKKMNYLINGSGLTWKSKLSAKCLVEILQASFAEFSGFAELLGSLPVGSNTGTLKDRFKFIKNIVPEKIRAKTGTLWSKKAVSSLAGFVSTKSGHVLVYALINNDKKSGYQQTILLKNWEDQMVALMQKLEF